MKKEFDVNNLGPEFIKRYNEILDRGLSKGLGKQDGQMCIEAAICCALGLPHGDDPKCVAYSVRKFKIALNDKIWSSEIARANGLRNLGIAQLGSLGTIDDTKFITKLSEKIIRVLIPKLYREIFPNNEKLLGLALRCEIEGSYDASKAAADAAYAADAADAAYAADAADAAYAAANAAAYAAYAADAADAAYAADAADAAADAAAYAAYASAKRDEYLILVAKLALEVLTDLDSPGVSLLEKIKEEKCQR